MISLPKSMERQAEEVLETCSEVLRGRVRRKRARPPGKTLRKVC